MESTPFLLGDWWYQETINTRNDFILKRWHSGGDSDSNNVSTACVINVKDLERFSDLQISPLGKYAVIVLHSVVGSSYDIAIVDMDTAEVISSINGANKDVCLSADESCLYYLYLNDAGSPQEFRKRNLSGQKNDVRVKRLDEKQWPVLETTLSHNFIFLREGERTYVVTIRRGGIDSAMLCAPEVSGLKKIQDIQIGNTTYFIGYGSDDKDVQYIVSVPGIASLGDSSSWKYARIGTKGVVEELTVYNDEIVVVICTGAEDCLIWGTWEEFLKRSCTIKWSTVAFEQSVHHTTLSLTQLYGNKSSQLMVKVSCPACKDSSYRYGGRGTLYRDGKGGSHSLSLRRLTHRIETFEAMSTNNVSVPVTLIVPTQEHLDKHQTQEVVTFVYGEYGIILHPSYDPFVQYLVDNGVHVAYAHVRGGGELGAQWHHEGQKSNKQNAIDDFISVSEVVRSAVGGEEVCVIAAGASAGGAIAAAAINQKPGLYGAGFLVAPFISPLRAVSDIQNPRYVIDQAEFGRTVQGDEIMSLGRWSPLENVSQQEYPPMLIALNEFDENISNPDVYEYVEELQRVGCRVTISNRRRATHNFVVDSENTVEEVNWLLSFLDGYKPQGS